ncbi:MAG: efflux transporter outer membrane subunit [Betaproteobacteria bacterium]
MPLVALALGVSGCANFAGMGPKAQLAVPQALGMPTVLAAPAVRAAAATPRPDWWSVFGDVQLNALVQQALQNSPNLKLAQARIARAQSLIDYQTGADQASVTGSVDAMRQRFSANGIYPPPLAGGVYETANAQVGASYEFDLFGKNRAALDAALGQERAAQADAKAAELLLATQVTRSYFTLLRLTALHELAQRNLALREEVVALVQSRLASGLDSPQELRISEASLPDLRQYVHSLREQTALTRNALAALTGQALALPEVPATALTKIQTLGVPQSLSLDLLANRPDVAAAHARVEAGLSEVDVAKAQFYPNINLVAFAGLNSIGFSNITKTGSEQWGVGPAIRLPIFDGGRLRAQLKSKSAEVDMAIEAYNALLLDAVRDVADQVASLQSIQAQSHEQQAGQASAQLLYDIAAQRLQAGLGNRASVLQAQTGVLAQQRQAIDLLARALDTHTLLQRATGGAMTPTTPSISKSTP